MSTYTEHEQRQLDQTSGDALDRRQRARAYLDRPIRSKEAVALDLAVAALASARSILNGNLSAGNIAWATVKIDRALFGIAELRK